MMKNAGIIAAVLAIALAGGGVYWYEHRSPVPISPVPPSIGIEVVDYGCSPSTSSSLASVTQGSMGPTFDTTGADLLIVSVVAHNTTFSQASLSYQVGGTVPTNIWTPVLVSPPSANGIMHQVYYTHPGQTGPNASFHFGNVAFLFPSICVMALKGWDFEAPLFQGSNEGVDTATMPLASPFPTAMEGNLILASLSYNTAATPMHPAGYLGPVIAPFVNGVAYGQAISWKLMTGATENPTWSFAGNVSFWATSAVVFRAMNVVPPPSGYGVILGGGIL
jgi:hypothetical protein